MDTHITTAPARSSTRTGIAIVFVTLLVTLAGRLIFSFWERYDGSTTFAELQAFGPAYWPMNLLVLGPAFAVGFAAQAILAERLGRGRGRILVWIGAGLLLLGGALFALVATAHALPYDWAANHDILEEETGRAVVAAFDAGGTPLLLPYIVGSQAVIALGALITAIGGRLSGTVPVWLLLVVVVLLLAFFFVPSMPGSPLDVILAVAQALLWAALGWFGWRATRSS